VTQTPYNLPPGGEAEMFGRQLVHDLKQRHEHARAGLRLGEPYGSERAAGVGGSEPDWARPRKLSGE
jgi:hypothetical protein